MVGSNWSFVILNRSPGAHCVTPRVAHRPTIERKNQTINRWKHVKHPLAERHHCLQSIAYLYPGFLYQGLDTKVHMLVDFMKSLLMAFE